jgi:hypothetical protein
VTFSDGLANFTNLPSGAMAFSDPIVHGLDYHPPITLGVLSLILTEPNDEDIVNWPPDDQRWKSRDIGVALTTYYMSDKKSFRIGVIVPTNGLGIEKLEVYYWILKR